MAITTIGLDLAKYVFQVHGVDAEGNAIGKRRLRRNHVIAYFASPLGRSPPAASSGWGASAGGVTGTSGGC
jgi:hypothetical protein